MEKIEPKPRMGTEENGEEALVDGIRENGIHDTGSVLTGSKHLIHCLTIIGQIEGHFILPPQNKTTKYEHVIPQIVMHIGAEKHVGKEGGHGRRRRKALRPSLPNASHRQFLPLLVPSKHSGADRKSQGRFRPFSICGIIRQAGWKEGLRCQRYFRGCVP